MLNNNLILTWPVVCEACVQHRYIRQSVCVFVVPSQNSQVRPEGPFFGKRRALRYQPKTATSAYGGCRQAYILISSKNSVAWLMSIGNIETVLISFHEWSYCCRHQTWCSWSIQQCRDVLMDVCTGMMMFGPITIGSSLANASSIQVW